MHLSFTSFLYKLLIDPVLARLHENVLREIKASDKVIDIACGTGSLTLAISNRAKSVIGIDLSEDMIATARKSANKKRVCNAGFIVLDASDMNLLRDKEFDVAVTSMAVHQFEAGLAVSILEEMKRIASKVIIVDYNYPLPEGFNKWLVNAIEKVAGDDHYRNFRAYMEKGGINYFILGSGLKLVSLVTRSKGIFMVSTCQGDPPPEI